MPHGTVTELVPAPAADVFQLLHDYERRPDWDTLLQSAQLTDGARRAGRGIRSICKGKIRLGGIALTTEYVTFRPPDVAAVRMVNQPPFFETFAATIRHTAHPDGTSMIEYTYNLTARPRWLQFILHPVMSRLFRFETRKRLRGLRLYFEKCRRNAK